MVRRTYDVPSSFEGDWSYGDTPIMATNRPLQLAKPSLQGYQGTIEELVAKAKTMSEGGYVYVDGGSLLRQALDAGRVDDITMTLIPIVLGDGTPLFNGTKQMHQIDLQRNHPDTSSSYSANSADIVPKRAVRG